MLVASGKSLKNQAPQEWSGTSQNCAMPCSAALSNVSTDAWGEIAGTCQALTSASLMKNLTSIVRLLRSTSFRMLSATQPVMTVLRLVTARTLTGGLEPSCPPSRISSDWIAQKRLHSMIANCRASSRQSKSVIEIELKYRFRKLEKRVLVIMGRGISNGDWMMRGVNADVGSRARSGRGVGGAACAPSRFRVTMISWIR